MNDMLMTLPIIIPIIGSLCLASQRIIPERWINLFVLAIVSLNLGVVICVNAALIGSAIHLVKVNAFIDLYFKVDGFGQLFSSLASVLWFLTSFYAFEYMKHEGRERQFYTFFILTLSMVIGLSYSGNLLMLYLFYELITLVTFPLVIHANTEQALQIGRKYITYSFVGAAFIMLGMILLNSVTGQLVFIPGGMEDLLIHPKKDLIYFSYLSMFFGFGVKAAVMPLHAWLPAAMVAPTPVSALLHAVAVVKSGIFALVRITYYLYGVKVIQYLGVNKVLIPFAIGTILLASFMAMNQYHLKRRLAYSTVAQLGYIVLGILMVHPIALLGALLHLVNHAILKINMFFAVGAVSYMTDKKYVKQLNGLGQKMPLTFSCFAIAAISLIGIPPANGFVSKWFLGVGALKLGSVGMAIVILFGALLTASYLLPLITIAFFTKNADKKLESKVSLDPPLLMLLPMIVLTLGAVLMGLYPNPVIEVIQGIVNEVF